MQPRQQSLNAVWMILGSLVSAYAVRLGVWQGRGPATGFMPLVAGILICALGALQFLQGARATASTEAPIFPDRQALRRVLSVIAILVAMALLMVPLGFLATAFLAMLALLTIIELRGWFVTIAVALAASGGIWWVFTRLDVILPPGIWGF